MVLALGDQWADLRRTRGAPPHGSGDAAVRSGFGGGVRESPAAGLRWRWSGRHHHLPASHSADLARGWKRSPRLVPTPTRGDPQRWVRLGRTPPHGRGNRPHCSRRWPASTARGDGGRRRGSRPFADRPAGSAGSAGSSAVRQRAQARWAWETDCQNRGGDEPLTRPPSRPQSPPSTKYKRPRSPGQRNRARHKQDRRREWLAPEIPADSLRQSASAERDSREH